MERIDTDPIRHFPWLVYDAANGIESGVTYGDSSPPLIRGQRYNVSVGQSFPDAGLFILGETMFIR